MNMTTLSTNVLSTSFCLGPLGLIPLPMCICQLTSAVVDVDAAIVVIQIPKQRKLLFYFSFC